MKLLMVGARADGHAHVVLDAIVEDGTHEIVGLADDNPALWGQGVLGLPVLGDVAAAAQSLERLGITGAVIAVGDAAARCRLAAACRDLGLVLPPVIHPAAYVSRYAQVGEGAFIGAGAQVLPGAVVGELARVMAAGVVSHHASVGRGATIGPNATLCGRSRVGERAFIGAGAVVLPEICVGNEAVVGAGAVVTKEVPSGLTVVGVPARAVDWKP
ncbi:MAG: NeuD/PglB/VioB family sugar acetyltransferase [Armatimonadetes bacterium]|nr:NeuD/PglB/VioB family sugar acetyltransferase [Armatimonadota bacterium]